MDPKKNENQEEELDVNFEDEAFDVNFENEEEQNENDFLEKMKDSMSIESTSDNQNENDDDDSNEDDDNDDDQEEDDDDNENLFNLSEEEEEDDDDDLGIDLESFNKKFDKDFKSKKELLDFIKKDEGKSKFDEDEKILKDSESTIAFFEEFLDLNDLDLMRKQFEALAIQEGKDINDDDVSLEVEEKLQELQDSYNLSKEASNLRRNIQKKVDEAYVSKKEIESKRTQEKERVTKERTEKIENALANMNSAKNFYGVDVSKKEITQVYKNIMKGDFIKQLEDNPELLAETAMLVAMKEKIHEKSTGLSYSDGIKSVLENYEKSKGDLKIAKAQKRGSAANNGESDDWKSFAK